MDTFPAAAADPAVEYLVHEGTEDDDPEVDLGVGCPVPGEDV